MKSKLLALVAVLGLAMSGAALVSSAQAEVYSGQNSSPNSWSGQG